MSSERIDIVIREDGSRVVKRNIDDIGKSAEDTGAKLGKMKAVLLGVVTGVIANQLRQLSSQWIDLNSRVSIATGSQGQAAAVMDRLRDIARRTYSDINVTSEAYLRNAGALTELGFSTKEQIDFTESLANALVVSGAKAQRAETVTNALSKAIAGGSLRGMNLNVVLEQGGRVAQALAKGLGVGVTELRALGEQGLLTSDKVLPALNSQLETLRKEADSMPATIDDAMTNLRNQIMATVGVMDEAGNSSATVVRWIDSMRGALEDVTPTLVNIMRGITGTLDPMDEMSEGAKLIATTFILVQHVLGSVAKSLTTVVIGAFKMVGNVLGGVAAGIAAFVRGDFREAADTFKNVWIDSVDSMVGGTKNLYQDLVDGTVETIGKLDQLWNAQKRDAQDRAVEKLSDVKGVAKVGTVVDPAALAAQEKEMRRLERALDGVLGRIAPLDGAQRELEQSTAILTEARRQEIISEDQLARYLELLASHYEDLLDPLSAYNAELDEQIELMRMTNRERSIEQQVLSATETLLQKGVILTEAETQALREKFIALQQVTDATQAQDQLLSASVEKRRAFTEQLAAIKTLLETPDTGYTAGDATGALGGMLPGGMMDGTAEWHAMQIEQTRDLYRQIDEMRQADLISEQTANQLKAKATVELREKQLANASQFFSGMSALSSSGNKKLAMIGKMAAISQATIDGVLAVQKALAAAPPPVNYALAAAAAVSAAANVQAIRSQNVAGYAAGGYTGNGARGAVAGVVHGQEFVMNAGATSRIGVDNLQALQSGKAQVSTGTGAVNVTIQNYGTSKSFEVQQLSESDVRVIARDEAERKVAEQTPKLVAAEIANPNSTISKSLSRNTATTRKR